MPNETRPKFYVKSFFAETMQDAMEQARLEMGPDALLLNSREAPPEAQYMGRYEVVFGEYADVAESEQGPVEVAKRQPIPLNRPGIEPDRLIRLQRSIMNIRTMMGRKAEAANSEEVSDPSDTLDGIAEQLVSAGVEAALAGEIVAAVRERLKKTAVTDISRPYEQAEHDEDTLETLARAEIAARCPVDAEIGRITVLVGPPGSGKTTTLVKLAVNHGLARGKPVRLISADAHRIGGAAQLESYAAILGVPFQQAPTPAALDQIIEYAPDNTLLLIDTPGYSTAMFHDLGSDLTGDLAGVLSRRQEIDTHLVLTASMRSEAMRPALDLYRVFRPAKLLFTRLDEATPYGAMFCAAARRSLKLSFFTGGQSIPEDLEPASIRRIADALVRELPKTARAVA